MERRIKVILSKISLDTHDRGVKVIAHNLKKGGMEVIYLGLYQTPESTIKSAIQEDVDVIGISCLSGEHLLASEKISKLIKENRLDDVLFIVGGTLPVEHISILKDMGVDEVFRSGSQINDIIKYIRMNVKKNR